MKKYLLLTILAFVLYNCRVEVKPNSAKADQTSINIACPNSECVTYEKVTIDGMEFAIFSATYYHGMAPHAINLTKDKLEIELMQKQLLLH